MWLGNLLIIILLNMNKYIFILLLCTISSCWSYSWENTFYTTEKSHVVFLWENILNGSLYDIQISCEDSNIYEIDTALKYLNEDQTVQITLLRSCFYKKIDSWLLKIITERNFKYVNWLSFGLASSDDSQKSTYEYSVAETQQIGNAHWKTVVLYWMKPEQYKQIRNIKNPYRLWFEPTWNSQYYTLEEQKKCDALWGSQKDFWDDSQFRVHSDMVLQCYRDLPALNHL